MVLIGAWLPMFAGCAGGRAASECPEARQPVAPVAAQAPAAVAVSAQPAPAGVTSAAPAVASAPAAATVAPAATDAAPAATPAATGPSLPELKVHLSGMHIGGGPNDEVSKRPFISAIEGAFDAMRVCYKKAEDPAHGGTFGVDLKDLRQRRQSRGAAGAHRAQGRRTQRVPGDDVQEYSIRSSTKGPDDRERQRKVFYGVVAA